MSRFISFLTPHLTDFVYFRKASGNWNTSSYELNLKLFDRFIAVNYPETDTLTQEIADNWCRKRDTEMNNSCRSRIYVVISFIRYLKERGLTDIEVPEIPAKEKRTYIPHSFTEDELAAFFAECDSIRLYPNSGLANRLRKIIIPVFFRFLFSSGIRTNEARLLRRKDVSFDNGVVSIRDSKGDDQHYIVMHDTMTELMCRYDSAIENLMPGRTYFFPSSKDTPHPKGWVIWNFNSLWRKVSSEKATAYEFRHHYAVSNINSWPSQGWEFHDKLMYLSKSMGHKTVEETKRYFSIVPALSDILEEKTGIEMDDIIPEVEL